eukprot:COSAG06_NODE_3520_length_5232_cov_6.600429_7_plen_64_part_00
MRIHNCHVLKNDASAVVAAVVAVVVAGAVHLPAAILPSFKFKKLMAVLNEHDCLENWMLRTYD